MRNIVLLSSFMGRVIIKVPIDKVVEYIKNFHRSVEYDDHLEVSKNSCEPDLLLKGHWSD